MIRFHVAWKSAITDNIIVGKAWWDTYAAAQDNADYCAQRFAVLVAQREPGKPSHWVVPVEHEEHWVTPVDLEETAVSE